MSQIDKAAYLKLTNWNTVFYLNNWKDATISMTKCVCVCVDIFVDVRYRATTTSITPSCISQLHCSLTLLVILEFERTCTYHINNIFESLISS